MCGRWVSTAGMVVLLLAVGVCRVNAGTNTVDEGRALFMRYCASCHGPAADGHGPVAPALRHPATDLRRLSRPYGTPLPLDRIARFIDGRAPVVAHGDREMPVWGERFLDVDAEGNAHEPEARNRIAKIVTFLSSLQITSPP